MSEKPEVLLVDDDEAIAFSLGTFLEVQGYPVTVVHNGEDALALAAGGRFPLILADIYIDRVTGLDILETARRANPNCAVILMTARGSLGTTVEAEAGGVFDYLAKPIELRHLLEVVEKAVRSLSPAAEPAQEEPLLNEEMAGASPVMVELYKNIARAARSDGAVLILGETGAGKELVARSLHAHSRRAKLPLVPVDCAAIPENLWESELFGAIKGAFTGAEKDRAGIIEQAGGGTVFLDEIGEIPLSFQAKLLRFLEAREFRPVGAAAPRSADVRLLAATNRQLQEMVDRGRFRADLYHRLNVLRIAVPALRERPRDIPLLAGRFLRESNQRHQKNLRLDAAGMALLESYDWPGNVRELRNFVERLVAMSRPGIAGQEDVRRALADAAPSSRRPAAAQTLEDAEREHVTEALRRSGGNRTLAAERLGIQRRTLYKMLERWKVAQEGLTGVPETHEPPPKDKA